MEAVSLLRDSAVIEFVVYGEQQPKGSARAFAIPMKAAGRPVLDPRGQPRYRAVVTSDNPKAKGYESSVGFEANLAAAGRFFAEHVPVAVSIEFGILRPASVSIKKRPQPTVKPDVDKLARAVVDGLTKVLFTDDAQVVSLTARKVYVLDGPAYTRVTVQEA